MVSRIFVAAAAAALVAAPAPLAAQVPPTQDYLVWVGSEATDRLALIRFGPKGAKIEKEITVGAMPLDPDGPHGVAVSPDGRYLYVTTAHGTPFGRMWKYVLANDSLAGSVELGNFPATLQISPDGHYAYVV